MDIQEIVKKVDHTFLLQTATHEHIRSICEDATEYNTASVCIPAHYVKSAVDYTKGKIPVCTVVGFPNGYSKTEVKLFETEKAIQDGATEIDMVINLCALKNKDFVEVENEIKEIKKVCGNNILKVIIETCLLTTEEKIQMCKIVSESGADFIKTSTGFSTAGATFEDIKLMKENVSDHVRIKAAGGIATLDDARKFIELGADRLGTSKIIKLIKNQDTTGY